MATPMFAEMFDNAQNMLQLTPESRIYISKCCNCSTETLFPSISPSIHFNSPIPVWLNIVHYFRYFLQNRKNACVSVQLTKSAAVDLLRNTVRLFMARTTCKYKKCVTRILSTCNHIEHGREWGT
jgi:hypothetical protein